MTEHKLSPEVADAVAATIAAADQRGWLRGYETGYAAGFTAGATAQKEHMEKAAAEKPEPQSKQPSQIILVDEGGIERVLDAMEHPDA